MNREKQKIVPKFRFPEFANDDEWEEKTIDDIKTIVTDYVANGSFASLKENVEVVSSNDYAYYIRLTDLRAGLGHKAQKYVTKKSYDFLKKSSLSGDEILMANIGANVGEIWQMPKVDKPSSLAPNMIMAKFTGNAVNKFIYYFFKSELGKRNIAITISGNAHPKINKTEFKQVKVVLPNNEQEQQKIASCLSSLDFLITAEIEKLDHLKDHKKGLLQQLFPAKGESKPQYRFPEFKNDDDWEETTLNKISESIFDGTHQTPKYTEKGIPFFSVENIVSGKKNKFISKEDYLYETRNNKPELGDVLITRIGNIGYSKVIDWDFDFSIYVTLAVIKKSDFFISKYLNGYFQSSRYQNEIRSKSLLNAAPIKINMDELRKTEILLPSTKNEQQKIADCFSSADDLIEVQTSKIAALKDHKKGLMQQLFPNTNNIT